MSRGYSGKFSRKKLKIQLFRDNLKEQNVLNSLFFGISESLKCKIFPLVGTIVLPSRYNDFVRNLPF